MLKDCPGAWSAADEDLYVADNMDGENFLSTLNGFIYISIYLRTLIGFSFRLKELQDESKAAFEALVSKRYAA